MRTVQRKNGFDYKWVIVAVSFLIVFIGLGFCSTPRRLFVEPITTALGIKRSMYSLNDTFRYIASATVNLFFATLVARFGAKKLICAGVVSLMIATLCFAYAPNQYVLWLGGAFLGLGFSWTTTTMVGSVINRWCKRNTGTIMGIVLAANGVGAALAAQVFDPFISQGAYGYRNAYLLTAGVLAALLLIVAIFFRNTPQKTESMDFSEDKKKQAVRWAGIDFADALKKPYFYIVCICIFLTGFVLQGITGVDAAYISDVGLGTYAASIVSISSLVLTFSKFFAGFAYDRFGLRASSGFCLIVSVIALASLLLMTKSSQGIVMMYVYAVCSSFALPLETIMLPIYAKDLFGDKSYDKFLGGFVSINTIGYATGGIVINSVYDILGSYKPAFVICTIIMITIFVLMQYVIAVTNKIKKQSA